MITLAAGIITFASSYYPAGRNSFQGPDNTLTAEEKKNGWRLLFDGKSTEGWRTYQNKEENSWEVLHGELHGKQGETLKHADLITRQTYGSFELELDWKIETAANSGLLYHVLETHPGSYETGPEYQLIDDLGYKGKLEDWQKSGADYAMHPPLQQASKAAGTYNHTRLIVNGSHVEHWLNGIKVADFTAWTSEWQKLKATGKWKDYPDYGNARNGYIALQDHGGGIWFKNIKIKTL
jgi:hypothetical protein